MDKTVVTDPDVSRQAAARLTWLLGIILDRTGDHARTDRAWLQQQYATVCPGDHGRHPTKKLTSDLRLLERAGFIRREPGGRSIVLAHRAAAIAAVNVGAEWWLTRWANHRARQAGSTE